MNGGSAGGSLFSGPEISAQPRVLGASTSASSTSARRAGARGERARLPVDQSGGAVSVGGSSLLESTPRSTGRGYSEVINANGGKGCVVINPFFLMLNVPPPPGFGILQDRF